MEGNREDLTQGCQRRQQTQYNSPAPTTDRDSFRTPRPLLETKDRRRPIKPAIAWSLAVVGVIAITTLAWLAGYRGGRTDVSMSALETIPSSDSSLSADLQASLSASDNLKEDLAVITELVANLEARLAKMNTSLDSATAADRFTAGDSHAAISLREEYKAIKSAQKRQRNPVAAVQFHLLDLGYDSGGVDGSWGEKTCKALKAYQRDKGVSVSCGAETRNVAEIQARLLELGYNPGPMDGTWGSETCRALKAYQTDNGVAVSCRANNRTVAALGIQ